MDLRDRMTRYVQTATTPLASEDIERLNEADRALTAKIWPDFTTCPQCRALFPVGETCPRCGTDSQAAPGQRIPKELEPEDLPADLE
jgi:rRNA maturation protein Nop10